MPKWKPSKTEMAEQLEKKTPLPSFEKRQYEIAYWQWYRDYFDKPFDNFVETLNQLSTVLENKRDWIHSMREANLLTNQGLARRLGLDSKTVKYFEKSEQQKTISIKNLEKIAEVFNCELIYFFVPKSGAKFSEVVFHELYELYKTHRWVTTEPAYRKGKAIAATIKRQMRLIKSRQAHGWALVTQRKSNQRGSKRRQSSRFV